MKPTLFILLLLALTSCAKPPTTEDKQRQWITENLGGNGPVTIEQVTPPVGPWSICKHGSYYYRVTAARTGKVMWAEAYTSAWSIARVALDGDVIYRYRYWDEVKLPIIGLRYRRVEQ